MSIRFSPYQRELIRQELSIAHQAAEKNDPKWKWADTVNDIQSLFEVDVPDREREGWPEPYCNLKTIDLGRSDNFKRFPNGEITNTTPERLFAIAYWLAHESNSYSTLTMEEILEPLVIPKVAKLFSNFLNQNVDENAHLSSEMISGYYIHRDNRSEFALRILDSEEKTAVPVTLTQHTAYSDRTKSGEEIHRYFFYNGWIVISPNDTLFCLLKNKTNQSNHLFIPIGVSDLERMPLTHLVFLNQEILDDFSLSDIKRGPDNILSVWGRNNVDNCLCFERQQQKIT